VEFTGSSMLSVLFVLEINLAMGYYLCLYL